MKLSFTLKFSKKNNLDSVQPFERSRLSIARNLTWVLDCAQSNVEKAYEEGSPRRREMALLCNQLRAQLKAQLTKDEIEEHKLDWVKDLKKPGDFVKKSRIANK